ncbi:TetR/AcrR family transcriptional regulator [Sediminicoccus sp. KRV36]|uniref:TetR/AcrR family transcriptional regulator n=1 Tax=Sediminicoccus sp. KRV36 TaxID=3133721 RepID=UPI00200D2256|nr:TetR/AcrR family transcriptional regulator [Sediminicoccus rosea]UPY37341.1 TetR/AcrR family transcriptional regulator [Sediminicoccus rosea]
MRGDNPEERPVEGSITRRRLDAPARREEIIRAAAGYFAEVGFGGSTRDLAKRAGVTQALLYKYFASKAELREAVFEHVYLGRIAPHWLEDLRDRSLPLRARLCRFYGEYTQAIFTYEWMRIFMWAGLDGDALNRRYLEHLSELLLAPMREEVAAEAAGRWAPQAEDLWNLHGGIIYLGIRRFIYHLPVPEDVTPVIEAAVDRFLHKLA